MGLSQPDRLDRIRGILEKLQVPVKLPDNLAENDLLELLKHDKKAVNKWPRFVLVSDIGRTFTENGQYAVEVSRELVEKILHKL